ncbi:dimethylarginine dimethylaminohydrolase family protein [Clostridium perfringens]|uniref:dimethylarginine dimethylaminohydrolase family protein n=1 Tax=Clostridium perfringens TaxID=1502 RepID=UPI00297345FD|nr:arginine deiminase family protein [Clostridium perfringens]MDM0494598.1 arginine deiminase family protein [Clostridium perfringens]
MEIRNNKGYGKLKTVIVCYPCSFKVKGKVKINYPLMYEQYNSFINLISREGVKVQLLEPIYGENQVFTRDVAFVIGDTLFISKMSNKERIEETKALEKYIKNHNLKVYRMENKIEGGDVIVYENYIFIGLSKRTTLEAIKELKEYINEYNMGYEIIEISFNKEKMLHLDCVFNILGKDKCIISDYLDDKDKIKKRIKNCYNIDKKTSEELGANIVALGDGRILTSNKTVFDMLKKDDFEVFYLNYSEILKAGGGFTCSTLYFYIE